MNKMVRLKVILFNFDKYFLDDASIFKKLKIRKNNGIKILKLILIKMRAK